LFSSGQAVWHAEQGNPYFLANAGIARTWTPGSGAACAVGELRLNAASSKRQATQNALISDHRRAIAPIGNLLGIHPPARTQRWFAGIPNQQFETRNT
jgi:hypothetical protein